MTHFVTHTKIGVERWNKRWRRIKTSIQSCSARHVSMCRVNLTYIFKCPQKIPTFPNLSVPKSLSCSLICSVTTIALNFQVLIVWVHVDSTATEYSTTSTVAPKYPCSFIFVENHITNLVPNRPLFYLNTNKLAHVVLRTTVSIKCSSRQFFHILDHIRN